MKGNFVQLSIHCVWATWDRLPLITPEIQPLLYAEIIRQCQKLGCPVIAIGGITDHIHLLIGLAPTVCVSELMKSVKGSSSHFITHRVNPQEFFKWQGSYGVFSVSHDDIDRIAHYIKNQETHHKEQSTILIWETTAQDS